MTNITTWTELNAIRNSLGDDYQLMNNLSSADLDYEGIGDVWEPIGGYSTLPDWDSVTEYIIDDEVLFSGDKYKCIAEGNFGLEPNGNPEYWESTGSATIYFTGSFNGNGYTIKDVIISKGLGILAVGFFGAADTGSSISNVGIIDATVYGGFYVGILVGLSNSTINKCYSSGIVVAQSTAGGLVGQSNGPISNSYSPGVALSANNTGGGLVGNNYNTIKNCYAAGYNISLEAERGGGLVGQNSFGGALTNCFTDAGVVDGTGDVGGLIGIDQGTTSVNCGWMKAANSPANAIGDIAGSPVELITYNIKVGGGAGYIDDNQDWFYDKTRDIYDTTSPVWDFTTPVWYEHAASFPDFVSGSTRRTTGPLMMFFKTP